MKQSEFNDTLREFIALVILSFFIWLDFKLKSNYRIQFFSKKDEDLYWNDLIPKPILTTKKLRSYKGCENYSDEEAEQVIETLFQLSILGFNAFESKYEQSIIISNK